MNWWQHLKNSYSGSDTVRLWIVRWLVDGNNSLRAFTVASSADRTYMKFLRYSGKLSKQNIHEVPMILGHSIIAAYPIMLSILGKIITRLHIEISFSFSQKTGFDISCKLSPVETICMKCQILFSGHISWVPTVCMKCQILFSGKNKKITNLLYA